MVEFRFSGVSLAGRSVTAFETLTHKGITLTVHADLEDEAQTVRIPKILTTLADPADGGGQRHLILDGVHRSCIVLFRDLRQNK